MWIRLRLDIGWRDLCYGFFSSLRPGSRQVAQETLEQVWSEGGNDALACLSVRSGFDLLLQALKLPIGSEVLFSAVTVQDMPLIAEAHDLIPVPVDVSGSDYHIDRSALQNAITSRSKLLVISHLFGARPDIQEILELARKHNLLVVEDCAQAWCEPDWRGNMQADASLFSFGTIKTATALGGALCRVRDPDILARMRDLQNHEPVQIGRQLTFKICKLTVLKAISTKRVFGILTAIGKRLGKNVDDILGGLTRGFSESNLLHQLRQQPSIGILRLLKHRLQTYDSRRINLRTKHALRLIDKLGLEKSQPELLDSRHSFWLFPFLTNQPDALKRHLQKHGFDTTQRGRLTVVPPASDQSSFNCPRATELLNQTLFLPCYPEMTDTAIDEMCELILCSKLQVGHETELSFQGGVKNFSPS
ncbi:aminotransferase class I/II-fold pyridoxal phosphate-dependent enzyme [uncultured Gimesia sp.]|uniref:aminotransferase class I/II-fold pyridoxal phosphate-dependent enzyme n=1 Tax=uncultured Gimesia sp. TaxID=1678688 RepID=UPI00260B1DC7|nr:aminotransferase class I/II-fold pyridoxal phosphate-dependent enzyme [uncultured Gimesia sp.]